MHPYELYTGAISFLRRNGWRRFTFRIDNGACLLSALERTENTGRTFLSRRFTKEIAVELRARRGRKPRRGLFVRARDYNSIWHWNDCHARDYDEVIVLLWHLAERHREDYELQQLNQELQTLVQTECRPSRELVPV